MRLWTMHPKYLDAKGLTALWREALLARAVLGGQTKGYVNHPQLVRFRESGNPLDYVEAYLRHVYWEALRRGYRFDGTKLAEGDDPAPLAETSGQLHYEWAHLLRKLEARAPDLFVSFRSIAKPASHPLFRIIDGPVRDWEKR